MLGYSSSKELARGPRVFIPDFKIAQGDSGSGIFLNGELCGVCWGQEEIKDQRSGMVIGLKDAAAVELADVTRFLAGCRPFFRQPCPPRPGVPFVPPPVDRPSPKVPMPDPNAGYGEAARAELKEIRAILAELSARPPVPGPAGPAGEAGPRGPAGPAGPAGKDGRDGKDLVASSKVAVLEQEIAALNLKITNISVGKAPDLSGVQAQIDALRNDLEQLNGALFKVRVSPKPQK